MEIDVARLRSPLARRLVAAAFENRRAILTFGDQALVSVTSFVTGVIVGRTCSKQEFGLYVLAFMVFYSIAELQSNLLFGPYTVYHPRLSHEEAREYRGLVLMAQLAFALATGALLFGVAAVVGRIPSAPPGLDAVLRALSVVMGFMLTRDGIRRLCFARLRTMEAWVLDLIVGILQLGALFLLADMHRLSAVTAMIAAGGAAGVVAAGWLVWQHRAFQLRVSDARAKIRTLWNLGGWMSANTVVSSATVQAYPWLITSIAGASAMAVVAASGSVTMVVNPAIFALLNYVGPAAAHALAAGGTRRLRQLILNAGALFLLVAVPVCALALLFGERAVALVYGNAYANNGTIVALYALMLIPAGLSAVTSRGLVAIERADVDLKVNLLPLATLLVASVFVIPHYAAVGAVAAFLAGHVLGAVVRCWAFARLSARTPSFLTRAAA